MTLLSIIVPSYNAQYHLERALEPLVGVPGDFEVLVIDDGSDDGTGSLADRYVDRYPNRFRVLHQPNAGHGGAINAGIDLARGLYLKVLDADDWLGPLELGHVLDSLARLEEGDGIDAMFTDYVYERHGKRHRISQFEGVFPAGIPFGWDCVKSFGKRQYLMMHAIIFRTQILRESGLRLPEHTYYVDSLFALVPLGLVRRMYYLPVPLYHYVIGRPGQSVDGDVMVTRVDQQLRVCRLALAALPHPVSDSGRGVPPELRAAMTHYVEAVCAVTLSTLTRAGTSAHLSQREAFWDEVREQYPWMHARMRWSLMVTSSRLPGSLGRYVTTLAYQVARRAVGFT